MARRTRKKLVDLEIDETSGVDHPAHLHEGWLVMKELDDSLAAAEGALTTDNIGEDEVDLETTETPVEEEATDEEAVVEEEVAEVAPEPVLAAAPSTETSSDETENVKKEMEDLRKALDTERDARMALEAERELEKAVSKCNEWAIIPGMDANVFAPVLCSFRSTDPKSADALEELLNKASVALDATGIFKELGSSADTDGADAWSQITSMAGQAIEAGRAENMAKAVSLVSSENPDLYARYRLEKGV